MYSGYGVIDVHVTWTFVLILVVVIALEVASVVMSEVVSMDLEVNAPKKFCINKSPFAKKRNAKRVITQ